MQNISFKFETITHSHLNVVHIEYVTLYHCDNFLLLKYVPTNAKVSEMPNVAWVQSIQLKSMMRWSIDRSKHRRRIHWNWLIIEMHFEWHWFFIEICTFQSNQFNFIEYLKLNCMKLSEECNISMQKTKSELKWWIIVKWWNVIFNANYTEPENGCNGKIMYNKIEWHSVGIVFFFRDMYSS